MKKQKIILKKNSSDGQSRMKDIGGEILSLKNVKKKLSRIFKNYYYYTPLSIMKLFNFYFMRYLKQYVPTKTDTVVDAGAADGDFTILMSKLASRVVSIEPDGKNFETMEKKIKKLGIKNVILVKKAIWNRNGKIEFYETGTGASVITKIVKKKNMNKFLYELKQYGNKGFTRTFCRCSTLDNIIEDLGIRKVDFVKMDIEGAELEAIEGMEKTLSNGTRLAIASYHIRNGEKTCKKLKEKLEDMGYRVSISEFKKEKENILFAKMSEKQALGGRG